MKAFFEIENDKVVAIELGNDVVSQGSGHQVYIEEHVAYQIDKCELYMDGVTPKLRVRDGETIDIPHKTEKELRKEELERELYELENEDAE